MYRRNHGFTLIESLIVLAIASILAGFMAPGVGDLIQRSRATTAHNWIVTSIMFARQTAVSYGVLTTLCPSSTGTSCEGQWHEGSIVFIDLNKNAKVDIDDTIIKWFQFPLENGTVKWRSFRNRKYLQITSMGYTNFQNGNFVYCPADEDPRFRRQIVVNMVGRARSVHDNDNDGVIEDRYGNYLRC
jgi:type IV fimbrial biogenesis protein FimT